MNTHTISDKQLIELYQAGDNKAFEKLITKYKDSLYSMILLLLKDVYAAEDILQDTFIKAINTIQSGKYKEKERFYYWIQRVGYNLAIDYLRKQQRAPFIANKEGVDVLEIMNFSEDNQETLYVKQDTRKELHRMMRNLPEEQRKVLILRNYLNLSFQEIAEEMSSSVNTALGRMRYALINLRKQTKNKKMQKNEPIYIRK